MEASNKGKIEKVTGLYWENLRTELLSVALSFLSYSIILSHLTVIGRYTLRP